MGRRAHLNARIDFFSLPASWLDMNWLAVAAGSRISHTEALSGLNGNAGKAASRLDRVNNFGGHEVCN